MVRLDPPDRPEDDRVERWELNFAPQGVYANL